MGWKEALHEVAADLEQRIDRRARPRADRRRAMIIPYRGIGRTNELIVRGRVIADARITRAREAEPVWRNLLNSYRRFQSDELPGVRIRASYRDSVVESVTDDEGHFQVRLQPELLDETRMWHEVRLTGAETEAVAQVLVPPRSAEFGIISDIDDTIVETGATSLKTMVQSVLLRNAAMRTAFEGVADLYRALHRDRNPIFFVSSGPWNLYDLLADFMEIQSIPAGPIFLQDYGVDEATFIHDPHDVHKLREIQAILDYYPTLPFILIGDSGQRDPEIYLRTIQANPGRIRLAIIRDVTTGARDKSVASIAAEASTAGVEMLLVEKSSDALAHIQRTIFESAKEPSQ